MENTALRGHRSLGGGTAHRCEGVCPCTVTGSVGAHDGHSCLMASRNLGESPPIGGSGKAANLSPGAPRPANPPFTEVVSSPEKRNPYGRHPRTDPCPPRAPLWSPGLGLTQVTAALALQSLLSVTDRSHPQGRGLHYPSRTEMETFPPRQQTPLAGLQRVRLCDTDFRLQTSRRTTCTDQG